MHISGTCVGPTANIQVGAICDILTISRTNSILDACDSPKNEPAYLATKYITKKIKNKKKTDPSLLHLSSQYVFRFQSLYAYISR